MKFELVEPPEPAPSERPEDGPADGQADPDPDERTAFTPYEYILSLELRGVPGLARGEVRERFGRALFDRLEALDLPLACGDPDVIFADFLPGRGEREFPTDTSWEEDGRDHWYEPRLHGDRADGPQAAPEPPARGTVTVFETGGLLQFVPYVPAGAGRAVAPVIAARSNADPAMLGRALAAALRRSAMEGRTGDADPWRSRAVTGTRAWATASRW